MSQVLAAVPTSGLDAVLVAVELVIESGALSAEHVLMLLARLNATPTPACVETSLQLKEAPRPTPVVTTACGIPTTWGLTQQR
ncbi:MAG: hypothetical protein IPN98_11190 [Propionivibrio sp.]|nr:hypothetical protein [Propionivibrio sp.]